MLTILRYVNRRYMLFSNLNSNLKRRDTKEIDAEIRESDRVLEIKREQK